MHRSALTLLRTSIAAKSTAIIVAIVGSVGLALLALAVLFAAQQEEASQQARLAELLDIVQPTVAIACFMSDQNLADEVARGLLKYRSISRVSVHAGTALLADRGTKESAGGDGLARPAALPAGTLVRRIASPFKTNEIVGEIALVPDPVEMSGNVLHAALLAAVPIAVQIVFTGLGVVLVVIRLITLPISRISARLHEMHAELGEKLQVPVGNERDEVGRLVHDVNTMADDLVAILNTARRSERLLSEAQRLGHVGSWYSNMKGRLSWSAELYRLYGVVESFLPTDESVLDLVHPDDRAAMKAWLADVALGKESRELEYRVNRPDGALRYFRCQGAAAFDSDTGRAHMAGTVQDVTEEKRIERMKAEFVSTVSHELRSPLTSIRGSLGLLTGGVAGALPPQARELVLIAERNSERLIRLVNDILDTEKIESGKMVFDLKVMELQTLVEHAVESMEGYAREHRVVLRVAAPEEPIRASVDADRFTQVMTNLISNAVKFSPAEAIVEIELGRAADGGASIEVRDRGPGIPSEFQPRIFQRFSQADSSSSRQKGGTGLGLSIAKAIVEHLGGTIGYRTSLGEGSTFFVQLPAAPGAAPATTAALAKEA